MEFVPLKSRGKTEREERKREKKPKKLLLPRQRETAGAPQTRGSGIDG